MDRVEDPVRRRMRPRKRNGSTRKGGKGEDLWPIGNVGGGWLQLALEVQPSKSSQSGASKPCPREHLSKSRIRLVDVV